MGVRQFQRLMSFILIFCIAISSSLTAFSIPNGDGGKTYYSSDSSGSGGNGVGAVSSKNGGYRISLLFLSGKQENTSILDSLGNVNIDLWLQNKDKIKVLGSLDVYWEGNDSPSNVWSYGLANKKSKSNFILFDYQDYNRADKLLMPSERNMISAQALGLSDFPWKYNEDIGNVDNITQLLVKKLDDTVNIELYPSSPEGSRVVESPKYALTEDCAKIVNTLSYKSGLVGEDAVQCLSAYPEGSEMYNKISSSSKNVFEKGTYEGEIGSYRLMIEPYQLVQTDSSGTEYAMTTRDMIWYFENVLNKDTGGLIYNLGNYLVQMADITFMKHKDILNINSDIGYQGKDLDKYTNLLKKIDFTGMKSVSKWNELYTQIKKNERGYAIASISSEMVGAKSFETYIGNITHIFLPDTLNKNKEVEAYSMEYRGQQADQSFLDATISTLVKGIEKVVEPEGLTGTKVGLSGDIFENEVRYKALTDGIERVIEEEYNPTQFGEEIRALTSEVISNNNFKEFLKQVYYQNVAKLTTDSVGTILDTPSKEWLKILVLQTMLENKTIGNADNNKDTILSLVGSDLANGTSYEKLGFKALNSATNAEIEKLVKASTNYKSSYEKVGGSDNTIFAENNISGDEELGKIFNETDNVETQADGVTPKFIRKPIYIGYNTLDLARYNTSYTGILEKGNDLNTQSDNYPLIRMRYNFIGDMTDNLFKRVGKYIHNSIANTQGLTDRELEGYDTTSVIHEILDEVVPDEDAAKRLDELKEKTSGSELGNKVIEPAKELANELRSKMLPNGVLDISSNSYKFPAYYGAKVGGTTDRVWGISLNGFSLGNTQGLGVWLSSLVGGNEFESSALARGAFTPNTMTHAGYVDENKLGEFNAYNGLGRTKIGISGTFNGSTTPAQTIYNTIHDDVNTYTDAIAKNQAYNGFNIINDASYYNVSNNKGSLVNAVNNYVLNRAITQSKDKALISADDGLNGSYGQNVYGEYGTSQVIWGSSIPMDIVIVTENELAKKQGESITYQKELMPLSSLSGDNDYTILPNQFWVTPGIENNISINNEFKVKINGKESIVKVKEGAIRPATTGIDRFISNYSDAVGSDSTYIDINKAKDGSLEQKQGKLEILSKRFRFNGGTNSEHSMGYDYSAARKVISNPSHANFGQLTRLDSGSVVNKMNIVPTIADKEAYVKDDSANRLQLVLVVSVNEKPKQYNIIEDTNGTIVDIQKVAQDRTSNGNIYFDSEILDRDGNIGLAVEAFSNANDYHDVFTETERETITSWRNSSNDLRSIYNNFYTTNTYIPDLRLTTLPTDSPYKLENKYEATNHYFPVSSTVYVRYKLQPSQYNVYRNADGTERVEKVSQRWIKDRSNTNLSLTTQVKEGSKEYLLYQVGLSTTDDDIANNQSLTGSESNYKYWDYLIGKGKMTYKLDLPKRIDYFDLDLGSKDFDSNKIYDGKSYGYEPRYVTNTMTSSYLSTRMPSSRLGASFKPEDGNTVYCLYVEDIEDLNGFHLVLEQNRLTKRVSYVDIARLVNTKQITGIGESAIPTVDIDKLKGSYQTYYLNMMTTDGFSSQASYNSGDYYRNTLEIYAAPYRSCGHTKSYYTGNTSFDYKIGLNGGRNANFGLGSNGLFSQRNLEGSKTIASKDNPNYLIYEQTSEFNTMIGVTNGDVRKWGSGVGFETNGNYTPWIVIWRGSDKPTLAMHETDAKATGLTQITSGGNGFEYSEDGVKLFNGKTTRESKDSNNLAKPSTVDGTTITNLNIESPTLYTGGYALPITLRLGATSVGGSLNALSNTYHGHASQSKPSKSCWSTTSISQNTLNTNYRTLDGTIHTRVFIGGGGRGWGDNTQPTAMTSFKIGNNQYTKGINQTNTTDKVISYYTKIPMRYDTNTTSDLMARVWSERSKAVKAFDRLVVGYIPASSDNADSTNDIGNLAIESDMWSIHTKAVKQKGKNTVLPGGAIYRLQSGLIGNKEALDPDKKYVNNTKVGIKGYFAVIPSDIKGVDSGKELFSLEPIKKAYNNTITEVKANLEQTYIQQYINNKEPKATNDKKYNLKALETKERIVANANDLNIIAEHTDESAFYRVFSEWNATEGYNIKIGKTPIAQATTLSTIKANEQIIAKYKPSIRSSEPNATEIVKTGLIGSITNATEKAIVEELEQNTRVVTGFINSIEFNRGTYKTDIGNYTPTERLGNRYNQTVIPGKLTIQDDITSLNYAWYNEESDGLGMLLVANEFVLGLSNANAIPSVEQATRTSAINPEDTPTKKSTSETYSKYYDCYWQTIKPKANGSAENHLANFKFGSLDVNLSLDYKKLYRSRVIAIPNATVMDLS